MLDMFSEIDPNFLFPTVVMSNFIEEGTSDNQLAGTLHLASPTKIKWNREQRLARHSWTKSLEIEVGPALSVSKHYDIYI